MTDGTINQHRASIYIVLSTPFSPSAARQQLLDRLAPVHSMIKWCGAGPHDSRHTVPSLLPMPLVNTTVLYAMVAQIDLTVAGCSFGTLVLGSYREKKAWTRFARP